MKTYIVLLRGINVGGHKKVPMTDLRELLSNSGFSEVQTYIQSGNVILKSSLTNKDDIELTIQKSIQNHFGFEVPVIAKTRLELLRIFKDCPFLDTKKEQSYFVILSSIPKQELIVKASERTFKNEEFKIINDGLYFHSSAGYGKSKFNMNWFEKTLNVKATTRNYKTMIKLLAVSEDS